MGVVVLKEVKVVSVGTGGYWTILDALFSFEYVLLILNVVGVWALVTGKVQGLLVGSDKCLLSGNSWRRFKRRVVETPTLTAQPPQPIAA